MVLEATIIIIDNSESSRNGDYTPSRFEAQKDAVNLIFSAKTQANPESSVGLMTMGGKGPEVLVTLTTDFGKILAGLHETKIKGELHLATGIQIAGLALKHRQNKSQRQRVICFVGSPIQEDENNLIKLAKRMKKNNVAIDFVNFGEIDSDNTQKLQAFIDNVNSNDNSHLATVPPGPHLLSDLLITTPILSGENGVPGVTGAGGEAGADVGGGYELGVDPTLDPELALAIRMSLEEEKARIERVKAEEAAKAEAAKAAEEASGSGKEADEHTPLLKEDDKKDSKDSDKMDTD